MKLVFFDDDRLGVVSGDNVVDVSAVLGDRSHAHPGDRMNDVIERFEELRPALQEAAARQTGTPLSQVHLRPPLPRPNSMDCMAVNYMEDGARSEPAPINGFLKPASAIIGPDDTLVLPDVPATIFEPEAELGVVIGKRASNVSAADALGYVFGYVNFVDGSARGLPPSSNTYYQMKARETFAPLGPYVVTADEVPDPQALQVRLWVNGALKQDYNTADMAHKIPRCIEWISSIHTLQPGDVIATGTNHGGLSPMEDGDVIEMETTGLGRLRFRVRDDLKRTWGPESRAERHARGLAGAGPQLTGKYAPAKS